MRTVVLLLLAVGVAGCASTGSGERVDRSVVTRAEIEAAEGASTAQDLVKRLRPQWLRTRGSASMNRTQDEVLYVYVDGVRAGRIMMTPTLEAARAAEPNPLEGIPVHRIERLQYHSAAAATQKFGTGHAHGAIEVFTRR